MRRTGSDRWLLVLGLLVACLVTLAIVLLREPRGSDVDLETQRAFDAALAAEIARSNAEAARARERLEASMAPGRKSEPVVDPALPVATNLLPVVGRVIDERRRPIEGARVTIARSGIPLQEAVSDASGAFRAMTPRLDRFGWEQLAVFAIDAQGRVGVARSVIERWAYIHPDQSEIDVSIVVLRAGAALTVRVHDVSGSLAAAQVVVECGPERLRGPEAICDATGVATLASVPLGEARVRASTRGRGAGSSTTIIERVKANAIDVELRPTRDVDVLVTDADGTPIEGAQVTVSEPSLFVDREISSFVNRRRGSRDVDVAIAPTGTDGRTRIVELPDDDSLSIAVEKAGWEYSQSESMPTSLQLARDAVSVHLGLQRATPLVLRWHVEAGTAPVPPDGSAIRLLHTGGSWDSSQLPPSQGRMEGSDLVVDSTLSGSILAAWAVAPDDSLAAIIDPTRGGDKTITFEVPRRLTVFVRDPAGRGIAGAIVAAQVEPDPGDESRSRSLHERTDNTGRALFFPLRAERRVVSAARGVTIGESKLIGRVDLAKGDATIETVLLAPFEAILVVRVDGEPRLPARFWLASNPPLDGPTREDAERGELHVFLPRLPGAPTHEVQLVAEGYGAATAKIPEPVDDHPPVVVVDLALGGSLFARVIPRPNAPARPHLERFDAARNAFVNVRGIATWIQEPNAGSREYEFTSLAPGRYRIADGISSGGEEGRSYLASDAVDLLPGATASVSLDLSRTHAVTVRIAAPEGEDVGRARVLCLDRGAAMTMRMDPYRLEPPGLAPQRAGDGVTLWVDEARPLRVRAWHPWLSPAADGGEADLTSASGEVVLRLERGPELMFAAPPLPADVATLARVLLLAPGTVERRVAGFVAAVTSGKPCRCGPPPVGTFDLFIDCDGWLPVAVRGVRFDGRTVDLGALEWRRGSSLRLSGPHGELFPKLRVVASSRSRPSYERRLWSRADDASPTLSGLGPGRFDLEVKEYELGFTLLEREIEVDGSTDLELSLPVR